MQNAMSVINIKPNSWYKYKYIKQVSECEIQQVKNNKWKKWK